MILSENRKGTLRFAAFGSGTCSRAATPTRPPHPTPNVRDDRETPLLEERGTGRIIRVICPTPQACRPATEWHDGQFADGGYANARRRDEVSRKFVALHVST